LQHQIEDHGLDGRARLMGFSENFREVLETASVFAMSSHLEGFPMSLIEALSQGVPLVSFDCPRGPGEIVVDNSNGRLVPNGDVTALAKALAELMADADLRNKMGGQALVDAQQYDVSAIAADWVTLFDDLSSQPSARASARGTEGPRIG
jgi:glycosyltransferase involved in cell wall biosynthesis